jgi:uncharacterized membrane protein
MLGSDGANVVPMAMTLSAVTTCAHWLVQIVAMTVRTAKGTWSCAGNPIPARASDFWSVGNW